MAMDTIRDLLAGRGKMARDLGARLMPRAGDRYYDQQSPPPEVTIAPDDCKHDGCVHGTIQRGPVCCGCGLEL